MSHNYSSTTSFSSGRYLFPTHLPEKVNMVWDTPRLYRSGVVEGPRNNEAEDQPP